jgi:hypothetical protein
MRGEAAAAISCRILAGIPKPVGADALAPRSDL